MCLCAAARGARGGCCLQAFQQHCIDGRSGSAARLQCSVIAVMILGTLCSLRCNLPVSDCVF